MLSRIIAFAAVAAIAVQTASAECTRSYTVKENDFCDEISQKNNVSTFQLATLNTDKMNSKCTNLHIGDTLCLGGSKGEDCADVHTVVSGDTCDGIISSVDGLNTTILYHNNPQIDKTCGNIYIGEVLCVSKTVQVPPVASGGVVVPVSGPPATNSTSPNDTPPPAASPIVVTPGFDGKGAVEISTFVSVATPTLLPDAGGDDDLPYCDEV
jgi:LysM repeat protein